MIQFNRSKSSLTNIHTIKSAQFFQKKNWHCALVSGDVRMDLVPHGLI